MIGILLPLTNPATVSWAQSITHVSVTTYHYDNTRQGANTNETWLTPANVNTNSFGKLFSYSLDGYVYAEPLILTNVTIPGLGVHNVVFVATEHDTLYALDAHGNSGANGGALWTNNFGLSANSTTAPFGYRYSGGGYTDIVPEVGMTGTPVIDPTTGTIYVDAFTRDIVGNTTNYVHRIHAVDVTTGAERPYSPVIVAGSVPGMGVGSSGGVQTFSALQHGERPALCLANGLLVVAYASYSDTDPYHGWVFAYNATNLVLKGVFNTTPNASVAAFGSHAAEGGIWMGGAGICVDANNNLYFETGNGSFSANTNGGDYADSFVKLSMTNTLTTNILAIADYFTPFDQETLANNDTDLGSCGPLLLPDSVGSAAHPHLIVGPGKSGKIYLVDRDNMGHFQSGSDSQIVQSFNGINGSWSPPVYWNNLLFFQASSSALKAFSISNATMNQTAAATAPASFGVFNGSPVVSANGNNNGIVWVINNNSGNSGSPGTLYAFNATNVSQMLWSSAQQASRDNMGPAVKMTTPTVAGGKVYVGGQYTLSVYGLGTFLSAPVIAPNGGVFTNSVTVTISNTSPGAIVYYTINGATPTTNSTRYTGPFILTKATTVQAIAAEAGYLNSPVASASFINNASLPPAPWQTSDIGAVAASGSGYFSNGVFIVSGSGADVWNTADGFRFVYQPLTNGCDISARVTSQVNTDPWAKAGVMTRDSLDSGAAYGFMIITPGNGTDFQYRTANGVAASGNASGGALNPAPNNWVRLTRTNTTFTAYKSADGVNWTQVGSPTGLTLTNTAYYVGLAVTAHNNGSLSTATFDNVTVNGFTYSNPPPSVALTAPATNSTYTAAASVTITAQADALYDAISRVDFYANSTLLGSVSNVPYALTATGLAAGSYALSAVAISSSGLFGTSAPVNITVTSGTGQPYGLTSRPTVAAFLNMPTMSSGSLPAVLSGTGVFSDTTNRSAASGLIPYAPKAPQWKDNAAGSRLMAVPFNGSPITPDEQIQFQPTNSWTFPAGTVFVKNFDLMVNETNSTMRRLETQLLVRDINGVVYGVTYKWRPDNSDADLLASSLSEGILITNASGVRTQTWTYPSPSDCLSCHTPVANYVLGVNARQLNGNLSYAATGVTDNQIRTLNHLGLLNPAINESNISGYAQMSSMTNLSASLQQRVRSYLDANCQACHQPGGDGPTWDARYDTPLALQHITNYPALFTLGISDNSCVVKSKDIWRSVLLTRINTTDQNIQMPDFRNLIDTNAVQVLIAWINSLPGTPALAPVTITPDGGTFYNQVGVTIQRPDPNASIFYTLDGTLPATNSLLYSGALMLTSNVTLSATAFETNYDNSIATSAQYFLSPQGLSVSPNNLNFGSVALGQTNLLPFQVVNTGGQTLTGSVSVAAPFSISSGSPFSLGANQTGQVMVAFTPAAATGYSNLASFTSNGGNSTNAVVGTGVTPAQLQVSPATLSFELIASGTSASANFLVNNLGGATMGSGAALLSSGPFSIVSGTPFSLPGFGSTNIVVKFSPVGAGTFSNYVAITTGNAGNSTNPVTGSAAVVPAASFVGSPTIGSVPLQVVFTDNSTGTITNRFWSFGDGSNTNTAATSVTHTFGSAGTNNVALTVSGPVGTNTQIQFNYIVVTNPPPPRLGLSPALLAFGYAATGTSAQASLVASNLGGASLTNGVGVIGGGPFTILSGTPFNLPASGSTNIVVRFSPASVGAFSNYIAITTGNGGASTNALTGSGAIPPTANFSGSPTSGPYPLLVSFSDTSTGTITNRLWDWGDGASSNTVLTSLAHTYNLTGTNTVALTVTGPLGTNQLSRSAYIIVTNPGPVTVTIISTNNQVQLIWSVGTLQAAPAVTGIFLDVTNAVSPFTVPESPSAQFFRVKTR